MAESSKKSPSSNEKGGQFGKRGKRLFAQNDSKYPERKQNLNQLFHKMKLNEQNNEQKMDLSEVKEIFKISKTETEEMEFCTAGKIISFLEKMAVVLVQPSQEENALLNIGTNLFLSSEENWILLGQIGEIFGNVKNPLYAVSLTPPENNLFKIDDQIYFLANHPTTSLFHVEPKTNNKYNVIYHN